MTEMLIFLSVEGGGLAILKESAVTFFLCFFECHPFTCKHILAFLFSQVSIIFICEGFIFVHLIYQPS
uniref:Uncharacterized protein n=1 Tax=Anguilla anguilla TaxID=7936 RepID=A0A0E9WMN3_ANGAN